MRWLTLLLLLGVAQAELTPGERIEALMMAYHGPPARAVLERAHPQAARVVRALAADRKTPGMVRANALMALAAWPDDAAFRIWADALAEPGDGRHKHRVLLLLARTFADRAMPQLRPFLAHPKPAFQLTAVEAMGSLRGGEKALRARLAEGPPAVVRRAIQRRLDAVVKPGAVVR